MRVTFIQAILLALISAAGLIALPEVLLGHGRFPQAVPADRLIANLSKYVGELPDDPEGYYRLGRVHTLALETKSEFVIAYGGQDSLRPAEGSWSKRNVPDAKSPPPEQLRAHLTGAIENLNKAIAMRPTEARYRLTLACALEAGKSMIDEVSAWPLCPVGGVLAATLGDDADEISWMRKRFESIPTDASALDQLIVHMQRESWRGNARDIYMTLAYENRDRNEFHDAALKMRKSDWNEQIEEQYFRAMTLALPYNGKVVEKPIWGGMEDWTSYEAAKNYVRVVEAHEERPTDVIRMASAKATINAFDNLPRPGAITPIIADFGGASLLALRSTKEVTFDLDGTGRPQRWSWVMPHAGILVWDPQGEGSITSGRQLFGSVSWWIFFDNGYQALDALDDNRDGELAGLELAGLAIWFDRNSNGTSDKGEVVPLSELGIASISCRATDVEEGTLVNRCGMRRLSGEAIATYDWIADRAPEVDWHAKESALLPSDSRSD